MESVFARRSLAGALDAQVKAEMVSVFGSQEWRRGCRLHQTLDAIHAEGGFEGDKVVARVKPESAVSYGV